MARKNLTKSKYYKIFEENKNFILQLNKDGKNVKEISKIVGIEEDLLHELVKFSKLPIVKRRTYKTNDEFFDNLDSELKFYLLGYFIADGCMIYENKKRNNVIYSHSCRFSFCVSEDDLEVIQLFQKYIATKPIEYSNNQSGVKYKRKPQIKLRWTSSHMFHTLTNYGIKPNKTLDENFKLPDDIVSSKYFKDFIRGIIDGDGNIQKSGIGICFNSQFLAKQVGDFFLKFKNCSGIRLKEVQGKTCKWWILQINGGKSLLKEYYNICYHNTNFYLKRKRNNVEVNARLRTGDASPQSIESE